MKTKIYTRPVSIILTNEMFERIKEITDSRNIGERITFGKQFRPCWRMMTSTLNQKIKKEEIKMHTEDLNEMIQQVSMIPVDEEGPDFVYTLHKER